MINEEYVGSSFDEFLEVEGRLEDATDTAIKRVLAWQIETSMKEQDLSRIQLAERMAISEAALNGLLDPANLSVSLGTLFKAAHALGKRLEIGLA